MDIERSDGIAFEHGGEGDALLVLVHGLAATARVWAPMLEQAPRRWPGSWIAPDLRGHGASAPAASYAAADYAADIAALVERSEASSVTLLGHSLGGVIALTLAAGGRTRPERVFGLGTKVTWTDTELERLAALSQRQSRLFEHEEEAREQHRRQCGLDGELASALLERGIMRERGGVRRLAPADGGTRRSRALSGPPRLRRARRDGVDRAIARVRPDRAPHRRRGAQCNGR
jgi:pimeloyl-ACP methyl ester carboxylesterase